MTEEKVLTKHPLGSAGGVAFGPPGAADTGNPGSARYDPVARLLTISPGGSIRVTEGGFCK
jgi:hypothetical protein